MVAFFLTSGVNFIIILRTKNSYECHFGSFFSSYMYVTCSMFVRKMLTYKVDEIDGRIAFDDEYDHLFACLM